MSTIDNALLKRVQSSYERLLSVASDLNSVSDELNVAIASLDEALKNLNLGLVSWHKFAGFEEENGKYWAEYIGYARIGARWGIALSKTAGHRDAPPEYNTDEEWLFKDAPRHLRIRAVEHIPDLIETLITAGEEAVAKVREKTAEAEQLAELLKQPKKTAARTPKPVKEAQ